MGCQASFDQWLGTIMHHLSPLSTPQATVLALWSFGMVLARSCALTAVSHLLAKGRRRKEHTVRQQLREWYYDTPRKPDHYPHRFSKRLATRQPSTSNVKSRRPRHKARTPGIPSFVRLR